ncbi:cytochrome P450 [Ustulina deusta]|nr:cytochrome P450 [Ustulina deusta]
MAYTGKYYAKIRELHDEYGPVVRGTPEKIHVIESSVDNGIFVVRAVRKTASHPRFSSSTRFEGGFKTTKARREALLIRKRPSDAWKTREKNTVLDYLAHSNLVEKELGRGGFPRLAQLIQQVGAHNVSHTLRTIVTRLLMSPEKLDPLRKELGYIWNKHDGNSTTPYLCAVVAERLRMAVCGMNCTSRIFINHAVKICNWVIPPGTPIFMTTYWMHNDPVAFPSPESFKPNRW